MVKLKLQILLIPEECSSLPTARIDSLIAKKFLHLIDPTKQIGELLDAIVAQYQRLYPDEAVINIVKCQDKNQCDLDKDYEVNDVFESNDEVRVIVDNLFINEKLNYEYPITSKRSREEMETLISAENSATPTRNYLQPVSSPVSLAPPQTSSSTKIPKKKMNESPGAKARQRITSGMLVKPQTAGSPSANNSDYDDFSAPDLNSMEVSSDELEDGVPISIVKDNTPRLNKADILNIYKKQTGKKPVSKADSIMKSLQINTVEGHPYLSDSGLDSRPNKQDSNKGGRNSNPLPATSTPAFTKKTTQSRQPRKSTQSNSPPAGTKVTLSYKKKADPALAPTQPEKETVRRGGPSKAKKMLTELDSTSQDTKVADTSLTDKTSSGHLKKDVSNLDSTVIPAALRGPIDRVYEERRTMNILDSISFNLDHLNDQIIRYKSGPNGEFKPVPKHFAVSAYSCEPVYTDPVVDFRIDLSGESNYRGPLPYKVQSKVEFDRENNIANPRAFRQNIFNGHGMDDAKYEVAEVIKISNSPAEHHDDDDDDDSMMIQQEGEHIRAPKHRTPPKTQITTSPNASNASNASLTRQNTQGTLLKEPRAMTNNSIPDGGTIRRPFRETKSKKMNSTESGAKDENPDSDHHSQQQSALGFSAFHTNSKKPTEGALSNSFFNEPKSDTENNPNGGTRTDSPFDSANSLASKRADKSAFRAGDSFARGEGGEGGGTVADQHQNGKTTPKLDENGASESDQVNHDNAVLTTSSKLPLRDTPPSSESPQQKTGPRSLQLYAQQVEEQGSSSGSSDIESVIGDIEEEQVEGKTTQMRLVASEPEKRNVFLSVENKSNNNNTKNNSKFSTIRLLTSIASQRIRGPLGNKDADQVATSNNKFSNGEEPTQADSQNHETQVNESINAGPSADAGGAISSTGAPYATPAKKPALPTLSELGSRGLPEVREIDDLRLYKGDKHGSNEGDMNTDDDDVESVVGDGSDSDSSSSGSGSSDENDDEDGGSGSGNKLFLSSTTIGDKNYKKRVRAKKNLFSR
ncbi:hypothetical protein CORT_0B03480 [Candida orthopsilosis Co 90-125]|uniref:Nucleolar protein Dnt1-like N-terminal domain-containing protein n=1 Tax=Candida orthopsilosis (strain 90-125) TaxID=1136231 RepID=H8X117_CANO9|nr:hypothetical protein CORT_0B03480 [Candida orthopsilosis Co 90-125]CCG22057.1 hypothetical protein CORT_0B03480 [Candida orthopsilosis Co 90-125]